VTALAIGAVGGGACAWIKLPLAWMLGSMLATTLAALAGVRLNVGNRVRSLFVTVLGVLLGSAFTVELFGRIGHWLGGFALLAVYLPVTAGLCYVYFRRVGGFDRPTAYFAAVPGGVTEMTLVGEAMGGNMQRISLVHATRVLIVVLAIPLYFRFATGYQTPSAGNFGALLAIAPKDAAILVTCGLLGWLAAATVRMPAAQLVGPLLLSATAHLTGLTSSRPPPELIALAQVVVGAAIGSRFAGIRLAHIGRILLTGIGSALIMLATTVGFTLGMNQLLTMQPAAIALALAPGGLTEMSLVALALSVDTAFVSSMHIVRIGLVIVAAPALYRLGRRRKLPTIG